MKRDRPMLECLGYLFITILVQTHKLSLRHAPQARSWSARASAYKPATLTHSTCPFLGLRACFPGPIDPNYKHPQKRANPEVRNPFFLILSHRRTRDDVQQAEERSCSPRRAGAWSSAKLVSTNKWTRSIQRKSFFTNVGAGFAFSLDLPSLD